MRAILSTMLLAGFAASSAYAEGLRVEARAFHSNLRIDGNKVTLTDGNRSATADVNKTFLNTAGFGLVGAYGLSDAVDLGLGFSVARYYPEADSKIDQSVVNGFLRYNIVKTIAGKLYGMVGISRHMLHEEVDEAGGYKQSSAFTAVGNVDGGIGATMALGSVDLGLEYKYSNSVSRGRATIKERYTYKGALGLKAMDFESRFTGLKLEGQEMALTLGVIL